MRDYPEQRCEDQLLHFTPGLEAVEKSRSGDFMQRKARSKAWNILLALPYLAMLWVPSYNAKEPALLGLPFFYWYQLAWVFICSALVGLVLFMTHPSDRS
jgi:hypothetical protein